ncbi:hypothetical protein MesoLjLc_30400 [Mesorhizobium sp. L-8-10]|uniref:DUF1566 domain-containing protein n=1 Tax=Mesorhizobium sp. L-8-10 TaxID=2744523 RepID=UPI00192881BE|nr:DUF1566 domain-containing protein [Mesorhizobium sp. L-8-10]BCH31110.1 hypothetical protein MesoLjLc_30400 [Mesorhizobium sp. L-8-10]
MRAIRTYIGFKLGVALGLALSISPLSAQEEACGVVHKRTRDPLDAQRFFLLAEHGGDAFLDKQTCLVFSTKVFEEPVTIGDAMERCATLGQGGPYGSMGWQLPSMAELTSLEGESWKHHEGEFGQYKLPPMSRSETDFWTTTRWPGDGNLYATVTFSAPTTLVRPQDETKKAGVWCVRASRATGLQ